MGQFGTLKPGDEAHVLMTRGVATCVGIAALSQEADPVAGLMHIYCDGRFYRHGKEAVQQHARNAWDEFSAAINPSAPLNAVFVGGIRFSDEVPELDPVRADLFYAEEKRFRDVIARDDYVQTSNRLSELSHAMSQPNADWEAMNQEAMPLRAKTSAMRSEGRLITQNEANLIQHQMAVTVSQWLHEATFDRAVASGLIGHVDDYRFGPEKTTDMHVNRVDNTIRVGKALIQGIFTEDRYEAASNRSYSSRLNYA